MSIAAALINFGFESWQGSELPDFHSSEFFSESQEKAAVVTMAVSFDYGDIH